MTNQVLSKDGVGDNPDNHPLATWSEYHRLTRAALIQQQSAMKKQAEAAQEAVRAIGMQIAALEKMEKGMEGK